MFQLSLSYHQNYCSSLHILSKSNDIILNHQSKVGLAITIANTLEPHPTPMCNRGAAFQQAPVEGE